MNKENDKSTNNANSSTSYGIIHKAYHGILEFFGRSKNITLKESVEELLKEHNNEGAELRDEEREMLENVADFSDLKVSDVMVPRTDIIGIAYEATFEEVRNSIIKEGHTRLPVFKENLDNIVGFIHVKDLLTYNESSVDFHLKSLMREILYVPRSMKLIDLLAKMRVAGTHIAIILDEYGGTDGLVTIEDLVEEIIGDIRDEHDTERPLDIIQTSPNIFVVDGKANIEDVEEQLNIKLNHELGDFETISGFIMTYLGNIPVVGDRLQLSNMTIEIIDADERRIHSIRITLHSEST
jgi:magnesium and cobalt transporter